jgi:hypothetical protein
MDSKYINIAAAFIVTAGLIAVAAAVGFGGDNNNGSGSTDIEWQAQYNGLGTSFTYTVNGTTYTQTAHDGHEYCFVIIMVKNSNYSAGIVNVLDDFAIKDSSGATCTIANHCNDYNISKGGDNETASIGLNKTATYYAVFDKTNTTFYNETYYDGTHSAKEKTDLIPKAQVEWQAKYVGTATRIDYDEKGTHYWDEVDDGYQFLLVDVKVKNTSTMTITNLLDDFSCYTSGGVYCYFEGDSQYYSVTKGGYGLCDQPSNTTYTYHLVFICSSDSSYGHMNYNGPYDGKEVNNLWS